MSREQLLLKPKFQAWAKIVAARGNLGVLLDCIKSENKVEAEAIVRVCGQDMKALHAAVGEWIHENKENESCKKAEL